MALATLFNVPSDLETVLVFSFANQDSHRRIADAIFAQKNGIIVPQFVLDPIPLDQDGLFVWALNHQAIHSQEGQILNVLSEDITDLNFTDAGQLNAFIQQHALEHYLRETALGL